MSPIEHNPSEVLPEDTAFLSLEEYKTLRRITTEDETRDAQLELAIQIAEEAVEEYTGRDFRTEPTTLTRKYLYDGSGVLDIDDCATVHWVKLDSRELVSDIDFAAGPQRGPTFYWLDFAEKSILPSEGASEMGFTRNLDTYPFHQSRIIFVEVNADFGWPRNKIPGAIKQATAWITDELAVSEQQAAASGGRVITSESIADLGYGYQVEDNSEAVIADLSPKVRGWLDQFTRVEL